MSSTARDADPALTYPEPPASPLWHRHGGRQTRPPTPAQQKRNRELLVVAQHTPRPRSPRPSEISAEAG
ncbi:hypothetical protein [Streptomyces uncialis]|uniref:hypothetical protein n=1 Tax=Streptomyces uncialis TaxID=1048205 RepID=UPI0037ABCAD1